VKKLKTAGILIQSLADEQIRWAEDVKRLTEEALLIPGNSLVSAGMVAYAGAFTAEFR